MATKRILRLLSMAATCLLFTSCFDSKVPLSDPGKSKADERLAGSWRGRNDDGSVNDYRFAPAGGKLPASVMRLTGSNRKPDGTTEQFEPLLLSWYDRDRNLEAPGHVNECHAGCETPGYVEYAANRGGKLRVDIDGGRFVFCYRPLAEFADVH